MSKAAVDLAPKSGFNFDLCKRNDMLAKNGMIGLSFHKTGTTTVGLIFQVSSAILRCFGSEVSVRSICSGIFNGLGSGSNVDVCVITKGHKEYLKNHLFPNPRTYVIEKGYLSPKKTG